MRRVWLGWLNPVYAVGLAVKSRLVRVRRLEGRVVSVGSLSAGGAGKTPVVAMVVEMLREAGFGVNVLSRGYGRTGRGVERVGEDAARYGDEPVMLARRLGMPVWVGADRYAAGVAAGGTGVHVLDDGFQHRRLGRDVDVVVLTREDVEDTLLPGGNLREGLGALGRADIVVLREEEQGLRGVVPPGKAVWVVRRRIAFRGRVPGRVIVFCGIARAEGFLDMLSEVGVEGVGVVRFKDHHRYTEADTGMLAGMARLSGAEGFVTTAKDAVKLTGALRAALEAVGPACVAELGVELVEGSAEDLLGRLR